jgi:hypothetical protein
MASSASRLVDEGKTRAALVKESGSSPRRTHIHLFGGVCVFIVANASRQHAIPGCVKSQNIHNNEGKYEKSDHAS